MKLTKIKILKKINKIWIFIVFMPMLIFVVFNTGIVFPISDSLKGYMFFSFPYFFDFKNNQFVIFEKYLITAEEKRRLLKEVIGLPGDKILIKENEMWVNDNKIGELLSKTSLGKNLSPNKEKIVPKDHLFVRGTDKQSFDSRYEEFGFVPFKDIQKKAVRLW